MRKLGFTLIELLVVVAIVTVLVTILFPVFNQAKAQAHATVCMNNFRQVTYSSLMYATDYDDRYALSRYTHRLDATSADDKTWIQLVMPYGRNFSLFKCPSDYTQGIASQAVFDADIVPGDSYSRFYRASKRSNIGLNYLYLSPLIVTEGSVSPLSRTQTQVNNPSGMIMFGDSVFDVDANGQPRGGGSYLIVPPCRYAMNGARLFDTFMMADTPSSSFFVGNQGWQPIPDPGSESGRRKSGGLWPWHSEKLTVIFIDGHGSRVRLAQAAAGCDVLPGWSGYVYDRDQYLWDMD